MPTLLQIAELGQRVLRTTAKPVPDVKNPAIQTLIDDLIATVDETNGLGIAAPQVYQPWQVFIMASHPNPRYPHAPLMEPTAIINPKIISMGGQKIKDWEGCLSIPGVRGTTPRFSQVEFEYVDRSGKLQHEVYTDFLARIFQHEYDHLTKMVFLDRLDITQDIISEKEYQRLMRKK
ncbi:peptide deformylase [Candidatus Microgenomates bacterium]|nr:MAG: peptide deformylase [Candidatus Microgenomates bacterium]